MGNDLNSGTSWPYCGEIDVLEAGGSQGITEGTQERFFVSALHWGPYQNGQHPMYSRTTTASYSLQDGQFHTYTMMWDQQKISMYLDDDTEPYFEMNINDTSQQNSAGNYFHKQFFLLLNVAVGGNIPGILDPGGITALNGGEQTMEVDYVRVYQKADEKNYFTVAKAPGSTDSWVLGDDTNGYLYSSSSNNLAVTDNVSTWTLDWDDTEEKFTLMTAGRYLSLRDDLTGDNKYKWRLGGSTSTPAGVPFLDIYKFTGGYSYKGYTTSIVNTYTVTFVNLEPWTWGEDVYIHIINVNTESPTGWPGVKCEKTGTIKLFGDTEFPVYNCTFQSAVDPQYVIFNNGDVSGDIKMTLGNAFVDGAAYRTYRVEVDQQPKGNFLFTDDANQFKPTEAYNVNYLYGEKGGASYARVFTEGKLCTIVLPFAMSEEDAAKRGTFYKITSIKNGYIFGDEVAAPEAYVPYIYMPSDFPWFTDVEVSELPAFALNSVTTDEGYTMEFVAEPTTLTSGVEYDYYGFADGKFVKAAVATANPFRAYIKVPHAANAPATLQWLGDEATGISDYKAEDGSAKKEVFDLQGRRVENPVRGIYIINGKKAVVK